MLVSGGVASVANCVVRSLYTPSPALTLALVLAHAAYVVLNNRIVTVSGTP